MRAIRFLEEVGYLLYVVLTLDANETWAKDQGLVVINAFGMTEVGVLMISHISNVTGRLQILRDGKMKFTPIPERTGDGEHLYELVIPDSPDCPNCLNSSLRNTDDQKFHTGDFFIELIQGRYTYKGRNNDWIKNKIFQRIVPFHGGRYMYGRIDDPQLIIFMPKAILPRTATKGNVCRKRIEEAMRVHLNTVCQVRE